MTTRRWLGAATGAMAIVLATMSVAWACGNFASGDMTLANATDEPWDSGADQGANFSDCAVGRWLPTPHQCGRSVTVSGSNFENDVPDKTITSVDLYWLDEPFYAAGVGGPNGQPERIEAQVCMTKGVYLTTATVTTKSFSATVTVPPTANTTADGTYRVGATPLSAANSGKFYYGLNAVCAVWDHTVAGVTHKGSVGNGYNLFF